MSEELSADQMMRIEAVRLATKLSTEQGEPFDYDMLSAAKDIYEFIKGEDK
jgi:hypothetical protein